jgi:2-oxoglutarate dehydrogenase E2 component (dihydrolipoamide succinyltransferase)
MATEIKVPTLGESVTEATVAKWFKQPGDAITADEPLVELETDKVTVEVPAPASGVLEAIAVKDGETVGVGAMLGTLIEGAAAKPAHAAPAAAPAAHAAATAVGAATVPPAPSAARLMAETGVTVTAGSGKHGQVLKGDVVAAIGAAAAAASAPAAPAARAPAPAAPAPAPAAPTAARSNPVADDAAREERVRMSKLRQTIARRLKDAQNTAAMLTTFNDVDMSAVMALRSQYKDLFEKKHGVRMGFMGVFVKAVVAALKEVPAVNAEIDGTDLIYKNYYHIGVAVGSEKGLVVPVIRDADKLNIAGVEKAVGDFGRRARDGQLKVEEMTGGTFTISNGGVYGSLMSTPILNAPQSGILGMHRIEERPVVRNGQIVIRPMMYLALSYDHRVIDGKEAVTFLVRIKEQVEDPQRLIMDI